MLPSSQCNHDTRVINLSYAIPSRQSVTLNIRLEG